MSCEIFETVDQRSTGNTGRYPIIAWCKTHERPANVCFEVNAAVRAEREACAKVADELASEYSLRAQASNGDDDRGAMFAANSIAILIRGRGET